MNVWPASLPRKLLVDNFKTGTGDGRLRSSTDSAIAKVRRRFSAIPRPLSGTMFMSRDQLDAFRDFVRNDLAAGSLPFQFPAQGEDGTWIVQFGQDMPSWVPKGPRYWIVSLDLVILP